MNKNIDKFNDSIGKEFYIDLANKLEEMYNKAKTFGEITLVGDLIKVLNEKTKMDK
ncbi:MAG: hypothetical protein HDR13_00760 [Lachnospiraceae bacterium]|nr:hypothetical protein [Lachnospiraceae bacterium]